MQHILRRWAKRVVGFRHHLPEPVYEHLRQVYRSVSASRYLKVPAEFDTAFYLQTNPDIDQSTYSPYIHFVRYGHHDLRNPSVDFDIVWYLHNYGHTFDVDKIDPLSHFLKTGKKRGYVPHPPRQVQFNKDLSRPLAEGARRACLFAGYDPDERIDAYVLTYLKELARHADVFYLADCEMPDSELAKLEGIVKGAWAKRHGAYDFGSYSMLARDLVGWDVLSTYDEVVFANDSCYLVKPLDETFARMAKAPCAWWGLQATKGLMSTLAKQPFPVADDHIDIDVVKFRYLNQFEHDPIYDFHIGSYFMAFRKDVIGDLRFQRLINAIKPETRKLNIILKNEVGITRFLIGHGYEFATLGVTLTKAHPVYTDLAFDLIKDGFPLFKRYFLTQNHYNMSSLAYWKVVLSQAGSPTDIAQIEDNYLRTSNAQRLYRNFHILTDGVLPPPTLSNPQFAAYDKRTAKYDHYWGFPVCAFDQNLSDNTRSVFESVKKDPDIVKVIFTRGRHIKPDGINVISVPLLSREGQTYLVRCRNLFVKHGAKRNLEWPLDSDLHNIINLWHGIPLKKIGMASLDLVDRREDLKIENARLRAVIAASDDDRLAMHAAFDPLPIDDIWVTGLPRHDLITKPEIDLPVFLHEQLTDVRKITDGRKMILFCPTFRNDQKAGYYNFTPDQVQQLTLWLQKNDFVMGIREHLNDKARQYSSQLVGDRFVNVQSGRFPDIEMLYREAAMLVTDYSSCFIDYMLTHRPAISFAYDLKAYKERERGLFYELEDVFPGPIAADFDSLMSALESSSAKIGTPPSDAYLAKQRFFIKHTDSGNTARVVQQTKDLCGGSTIDAKWTNTPMAKAAKSITFLHSKSAESADHRRISILASQLQTMGWNSRSIDIDTVSVDLLRESEFVVFCALQISTRTLDLLESIRATGGTVIYDVNALIHHEADFVQSEYFIQNPKRANELSLLSRRTAEIMKFVDGFTVTSPALLTSVQDFKKPAAIVGQCLSPALIKKYAKAPKARSDDHIHISYISDHGLHAADFTQCKSAVIDLLKTRPHVVLHMICSTDEADFAIEENLEGQIHCHGLMSHAARHELLRTMDINLAPLSDTAFNNAQSALGVCDAALHAVPTIASPSEPHVRVIVDRSTGYLARSDEDWQNALCEAVDNLDACRKIGDAARRKILPAFAAESAAKQYTDFLKRWLR